MLSQQRERTKEEQTILRCLTGNTYSMSDINQVKLPPMPLVPLGRQGTDSVKWLEMPLSNIESTPRKASRYVNNFGIWNVCKTARRIYEYFFLTHRSFLQSV